MKYKKDDDEITNYQDYLKQFNGISKNSNSKIMHALDKALDIRKFEIEMYWKRATYFWAFIASTFAGLIAVMNSDKIHVILKQDFGMLISSLGIILSIAFLFVNKGSKYWQENWEHHVDFLEDQIQGPLYKTTLKCPDDNIITSISPCKSYNYSLSKLNQVISFILIIFWTIIFIRILSEKCSFCGSWVWFVVICILFLTIGIGLLYKCRSKMDYSNRDFNMLTRIISD